MNAFATISQSALAHNLNIVCQYSDKAKIVAVVKANAYGHHLNLITPIIEGSDLLAVSNLYEVHKLRQHTQKPILLLSGIASVDALQEANDLNCHIVVHQLQQATIISQTKQAVNVWIKVDTGMHRLGLLADEYQQCIALFKRNPLINIVCIMSHFACADDIEHPKNKTQFNQFKQLAQPPLKRSIANSAAILSNTIDCFDFVRPGIMLYGISAFGKSDKRLKPVMKLSAFIIAIKTINIGETVGYDETWRADKKTTIAIINIGYGDGYPRHAKNNTPVLINEVICPLVGRVSMDLICVNISHIKAKIGDIATLWGNEKLSAETIAKHSDTIAYELVTGVNQRVSFSKEK